MGTLLFAVGVALACGAGCSSTPPYRKILEPPAPGSCNAAYQNADWNVQAGETDSDKETTRVQRAIRQDLGDERIKDCWDSSWERHPSYDLLTVEFDDQGWPGDQTHLWNAQRTPLTELIPRLEAMAAGDGGDPQPLSIVVYTHGWHHSADPDDENVIAFRRFLKGTAWVEKLLCLKKRQGPEASLETAPPGTCEVGEAVPPWKRVRRVVGVYVGWRGDSVKWPLSYTSIWDRKLAAEQVAQGSVQQLFSELHGFYLDHDCHSSETTDARAAHCADVRMLTIGHSFGGLITYRALLPRLMLGVIEATYSPGQVEPKPRYAYGFGDLTVLINPAFEASRFESLAEAAAHRWYEDGTAASGQLPVLIVATSETDWATGTAFPMFRHVTTLFEHVDGPEKQANVQTVGWDRRYQTHSLALKPDLNVCQLPNNPTLEQQLDAEARWSKRQRDEKYQGFDAQTLDLCDGLQLTKKTEGGWEFDRPPFLPLWVMQADKSVIDGHNDFLNTHFVEFVRQIYYTILRKGDRAIAAKVSGDAE